MVALSANADEDFAEVDGDGRTFGHLAKPLKKLTNTLGHYLIHATGEYEPYKYVPISIFCQPSSYNRNITKSRTILTFSIFIPSAITRTRYTPVTEAITAVTIQDIDLDSAQGTTGLVSLEASETTITDLSPICIIDGWRDRRLVFRPRRAARPAAFSFGGSSLSRTRTSRYRIPRTCNICL
ncbi:unnamed protein product, partial [Nesidiocoris tenuis]